MSSFKTEESNIPTMDDISKLARDEAVISLIMKMHQYDGLTEKDALIMMVMKMTELKNTFHNIALQYAHKYGTI